MYIAGESYAGHYAPQLASVIMQNNKFTNQTVINLKGITEFINKLKIYTPTKYHSQLTKMWLLRIT